MGRHRHGQQLHRRPLLPQSSAQVEPAPTKHLVRVHPVSSRDACHRRAFGQRLFDDSPLLCDAPPLPLDRTRQLTLRPVLSWNLSGSVHLCSKWTPILSVHFGEWLSFRWLSRRSQPDAYRATTSATGRSGATQIGSKRAFLIKLKNGLTSSRV